MFCPPSLLKAFDSEAITPRLSLSPSVSLYALLLHPVSPSSLSVSLLSGRITAAGGMCVRAAAARQPVGLKKVLPLRPVWHKERRETAGDSEWSRQQIKWENLGWSAGTSKSWYMLVALRQIRSYRFLFVRQAQAYRASSTRLPHRQENTLKHTFCHCQWCWCPNTLPLQIKI